MQFPLRRPQRAAPPTPSKYLLSMIYYTCRVKAPCPGLVVVEEDGVHHVTLHHPVQGTLLYS